MKPLLILLLFVSSTFGDIIVVDGKKQEVVRVEGRFIKSGSTWRLEFNNQSLQKVLGYPMETKKIVLFIPVEKSK